MMNCIYDVPLQQVKIYCVISYDLRMKKDHKTFYIKPLE